MPDQPPLCPCRSPEGHACMRTAGHESEQHAALDGGLVTWYRETPTPAEPKPSLRARAIDAVGQALNDARYWLPVEGRPVAVDAVLALISPDAGYCPHCGRGDVAPTADAYEATRRNAVRIQQLLDDTRDRVRKLHRPADYRGRTICVECSGYADGSCDNGSCDHPCATIAALAPPKETTDA